MTGDNAIDVGGGSRRQCADDRGCKVGTLRRLAGVDRALRTCRRASRRNSRACDQRSYALALEREVHRIARFR